MVFVSSRRHLLQAHIWNGQFAAVCHHHHNLLPGHEQRLPGSSVFQNHIKEQGTTWGGWRVPTSSPITNPEGCCSPVRWMLNQKCWLATESHASDWGAWLSQLEPLGQFLPLQHMDKPAHMYIFHFLRSKDLDKCEAVDEVPKIAEKWWLGAPFHLGPLQSLKVKHENSLQIAKSQKQIWLLWEHNDISSQKMFFFVAKNRIRTWRQSQQPHSRRSCGFGSRKDIATCKLKNYIGGNKHHLKTVFLLSFNHFKTFPQTQDKCAAIANSQRLNLLQSPFYVCSWK